MIVEKVDDNQIRVYILPRKYVESGCHDNKFEYRRGKNLMPDKGQILSETIFWYNTGYKAIF